MTQAMGPGFAPAPNHAAAAIRVGDVFGRSGSVFAAHWATFSGIVLVAYTPVLAMNAGRIPAVAQWAVTAGIALSPSWLFGGIALVSLVGLICLTIAHAAIYLGACESLAGRPVSLSRSVAAALRRSPALLAQILLLWAIIVVAALLLVFPAFIVLCMYAVALPACIVERTGPIKATSRSAFLTKGNRWRIFGVLILVYLAAGVLVPLIALLARQVGGETFALAVDWAVQGGFGGFSAVLIGVLYAQLRAAREGVDGDRIAQIFD
jgi:hypothetical protein